MATELLQPGLEVIQEFRTVSPTIVTPTLQPCAIAPGFQILEALTTDANGNAVPNSDALASVPAALTSTNPGLYLGLNTLELNVSYNEGPVQTFAFVDALGSGLDAGQIVDQINAGDPVGFSAFVAIISNIEYVQLRSNLAGDGQKLQILPGSANTILGFSPYFSGYGFSKYNQDELYISEVSFPDPRGIMDELDIDESSIRIFVNLGTSLKEIKKDESFLRKSKSAIYVAPGIPLFSGLHDRYFSYYLLPGGTKQTFQFPLDYTDPISTAVLASDLNGLTQTTMFSANGNYLQVASPTGYFEVAAPSTGTPATTLLGWVVGNKAGTAMAIDDGDLDILTPIISIPADSLLMDAGSAQMVGTVVLTDALALHNKSFQLQTNGQAPQQITFAGGPIGVPTAFDDAQLLDQLHGKVLNLTVNGVAKQVTFVSPGLPECPILIAEAVSQINAQVGASVAYRASDAVGTYSATGTYVAFMLHTLVGAVLTAVPGGSVSYVEAGSTAKTILGITGGTDLSQTLTKDQVCAQINATFGTIATTNGSDNLVLTLTSVGAESKIEVGVGTANTALGLTNGQTTYGQGFPVKVGDALYGDGLFVGNVAQTNVNGDDHRIKLDREVSVTWYAKGVYFDAKNLSLPLAADRPTPNLMILGEDGIRIKEDIIRDTEGNPISAVGALLVSYKALRLDVSSKAVNPSLISVRSSDDIESGLAPINPDNPLALMLYFMTINAPGISSVGIGVDAVNSTDPDGTPEAYSRALTYLEAQEVYALAPASQNNLVHQQLMTHVLFMSEPQQKGERIGIFCPKMPTERLPGLATSGTDGDSTSTPNEFDTKLGNLASSVLALGVDPVGTIPVSAGLYLDIARNNKKYNISRIEGTKITIRVAFATGDNDDEFYSRTNLPADLLSETFSIYVRGTKLLTIENKPDYNAIAETYQGLGQSYGTRRMVMVAPELVGASVQGVEQKIPGYYLCAAIAGMVGQQPPQQGFTNFPITGFTRPFGSNDVFSYRQMNVGAAGGTYWCIQNTAGAPLVSRHQLTTDLTSVETRELSITKVVDFCAKFMRSQLRNFIGRFNITGTFLDMLATVVHGQLSFLEDNGVIIGGELNNIVQDENNPDTVLIDTTIDPPYPCNYLRLTIVI